MSNYNQVPRIAIPGGDIFVYNKGASIAAGLAVKLDTANPQSALLPNSVVITSSDVKPIGFTVDALAATTGSGRIQCVGIGVCMCSATVHVGDVLMTDSAGKVLPQTAGLYQVGFCMSEGVSGDYVQVLIQIAKNA